MTTINILLLTATITPKAGVPNLKRVDPKTRLQDYEKTLAFYLSILPQCFDWIVFAENSNSDISSLKKIASQHSMADKIEFVVFDGLDYPPRYDRAYGEFKLLDYAMQHSKIINQTQERVVVWKITGRYAIRNICDIVYSQPQKFDIYCNFRNFPKHWVDTFLLAWTPDAYQACLKGTYEKLKLNIPGVPEKAAGEELLRSWLDQQINRINVVKRFKVTPLVEGIRGADNQGYSTDNFWKFQVRQALNAVLPWLWL